MSIASTPSKSLHAPDQILSQACQMLDAGKRVALATVIETWGSSPRPVGAQLAISDQDDLAGSLSAGCVEGAVLMEAQAALADGTCKILDYGMAEDNVFAAGLSCGGRIRILIEPVGGKDGLDEGMLRQMAELEQSNERFFYEVNLQSWERRLTFGDHPLPDHLAEVLKGRTSKLDGQRFIRLQDKPLRLIVIGAVHIAQYLCAMAEMTGYQVTLIDNRDLFIGSDRFDTINLIKDWPADALAAQVLDDRTALVTLTHDAKLDLPSLEIALGSDCFYIGALGSRKTHSERLDSLRSKGHSQAQLNRIHGPVGLDIGSKSPAEIALSIMAELVAVQRQAIQISRIAA
jgi:xanthine dehydrogenase accessory factor